jgi:acyl-CoA reductase-like NAD-dependent aldehyde dehydrogenase
MRAADRGRLLIRFAETIRDARDELVELESIDSGKPDSTIRRQDMPALVDTLGLLRGPRGQDQRSGHLPRRRFERGGEGGHLRQVCSAGSRILVHESVCGEVVALLAARTAANRIGDPRQPGTAMGPLVSEVQMNRVLAYNETGAREGASLVTGERHGEADYFVQPTVFANVGHDLRIPREEIFEPVAAVIKFSDVEDALPVSRLRRAQHANGCMSTSLFP